MSTGKKKKISIETVSEKDLVAYLLGRDLRLGGIPTRQGLKNNYLTNFERTKEHGEQVKKMMHEKKEYQ